VPDPQTHDRQDLAQANAEHRYVIGKEDLPLSCPMPSMTLWNSHPKVYLPIHKTGTATCPYCGAHYELKDFDPSDQELRRRHRRDI
jgi:uncharacterized Zn-finger protein